MLARTALALAGLALAACATNRPPPSEVGPSAKASTPAPTDTGDTKVVSFAVSPENLRVDKVGMRDGAIHPDGNRDHAFTAVVEGVFDALFIVEVNAKGEPTYGYRADTLTGNAELPQELGGVIDTGAMTMGIGVVENGLFVATENGRLDIKGGRHSLTLYCPNTAALQPGDFVRLYVRTPGGALARSAPVPY